ncbi:translation elongation factor-like protein [Patescibacteria group bacterium]|nr:translation elongation factor-like protein [Patescibacteria group bacterium]MBU4512305.1 translation elongation factor-like protein [Patescibacteria group bacterium]MCG2692756.1 translation elongation factor-like protein [Candidatus Parcubacteria bacterium]
MDEQLIGTVTHYFGKIGVCAIKLTNELAVGDKIHIKGNTTEFIQEVNSIQVEHEVTEKAGKDEEIGIKVNEKVHEGDEVYKVIE